MVQRLSTPAKLLGHRIEDIDAHKPSLDAMIGRADSGVIGLLQAIQRRFGFVPSDVLEYVCSKANVPLAQAYGVVTFYPSLSLAPRGRHVVRVCTGTACHVRGADRLTTALGDHLGVAAGETTKDREFTLDTVACVGCCSLAPVLMVGEETFGRLDPQRAVDVITAREEVPEDQAARSRTLDLPRGTTGVRHPHHVEATSPALANRVVVGLGTCGLAAGGRRVHNALELAIEEHFIDARVEVTGCIGLCFREVLVELDSPALGSCLYGNVTAQRVPELVHAHFTEGRVLEDLLVSQRGEMTRDAAFFDKQARVVMRHSGHLDPDSIGDYLASGGFAALHRALEEMTPEAVIDVLDASGLRGRGGAGFPTADKWRLARAAGDLTKYVICNADEGDPGAFMDRNIIEGDPFAVIEGLTIAGYAIGASSGVIYVRQEYPLAVERLQNAITAARAAGFIGDAIEGTEFCFDIQLALGGGAFVCGEETALIASVEGLRGMPRPRPPYPVERGLWGHPTSINNVETLANVPWILTEGAAKFRALGLPGSPGTKVFSLAGDIQRGGMIEVPMGTTIREIVEHIGGGSSSDRPVKAVQIGGPSGGCLPEELFDAPVDYESLAGTGAMMGSGGLVVMDEATCMVDIARYFLSFTQAESCGKCTFCRIGTKRMLEILERLCQGHGKRGDLELLEQLGEHVTFASLCGLGKTAPNPVLTTLTYFREEYEAHLHDKHCPAGTCRALIRFDIDPYVCEGCTVCQRSCPSTAISRPLSAIGLLIDQDLCTACAGCHTVCKFGAVAIY